MKKHTLINVRKWSITAVVLACAAWAMTASAASFYDLRDISIEAIDEVPSFTLSVNGVSATLTALNNGMANTDALEKHVTESGKRAGANPDLYKSTPEQAKLGAKAAMDFVRDCWKRYDKSGGKAA